MRTDYFNIRERKLRILDRKPIPAYPFHIGYFNYSKEGIIEIGKYVEYSKFDQEILDWLFIKREDAIKIKTLKDVLLNNERGKETRTSSSSEIQRS